MNKVIRDGMVAVIYSPGFGAGWYSWNTDYPEILYDPVVVEWIEAGKPRDHRQTELELYLESTYPDAYTSIDDLEIEWLEEDTLFKINEYDGSESIVTLENVKWMKA